MAGHSTWANIRHRMRALHRERAPGSVPARVSAAESHSVRYEGYGPGDCALLVECVPEDRERTAAALRERFERHGGHLGASGSVAYLFNKVGLLTFAPGTAAEPVARCAWQAGAEDVILSADGTLEVLTDPPELSSVRGRLARAGHVPHDALVTWRSAARVELQGAAGTQLLALIEDLLSLTEVRSVHTNAEVAGELLAGV